MELTNQGVELTWGIAIRIWWWITWRALLSAIFGGLILGFIIGIIGAVIGIDGAKIQLFAMLLGGVFGIAVKIFFIKKIIGKKFKDFSLVLTKPI